MAKKVKESVSRIQSDFTGLGVGPVIQDLHSAKDNLCPEEVPSSMRKEVRKAGKLIEKAIVCLLRVDPELAGLREVKSGQA